jgi:MoxR-like ATPase
MACGVYRVNEPKEYQKAGPTDLIELLPVPGGNPLFLFKWVIETLVYGIVSHEFIHLSGPTGSAKSSLLEALYLVAENFHGISSGLGFTALPLKLYPVEMATYEAPGELFQRRSLKDGTTFDEKSRLVEALEDGAKSHGKCYPLIWLREIGRVHSSSVQGGLLNLMTKGDIVLPDGSRIDGRGIAWVADSNYQAQQDSTHTLVTLDDALKRRFTINLTLDYLTAQQEVQVLQHILKEDNDGKNES